MDGYHAGVVRMKKWDDGTIQCLFELRELGWTYKKIGEKYGVTAERVCQIIKDYDDRHMETSETNMSLSVRVINCLNRANIPINPIDIANNIDVLRNIDGLGKHSFQEIVQLLKSLNMRVPGKLCK
jgi:DNA-directed RNA polymerase alpha subunit